MSPIPTRSNPGIDPSLALYQWFTGDTTGSIAVSPAISQIYYVTVSVPCQGDTILSHEIEIIPAITAEFSASPQNLCTNEPAKLIYTGTSGAGITYSWNFAEGTVLSGSGAGPYVISWTTGGQKIVTLTITSIHNIILYLGFNFSLCFF
ncbi:MAG: hypothetical protein HY738_16715 [Bacteroidia bacterium]|nr:hypothetical protein [Bacteroidia bacterium]